MFISERLGDSDKKIMIWSQNQAVKMIQPTRTQEVNSASSIQLVVRSKDQSALTKSSTDPFEADSSCQSSIYKYGWCSKYSASGINAPPVMKRKGQPKGHELTTIGLPSKKA